ncbi:beta-amyrin 6-beta-monooxygenase-like [Daucus carota subsp. sativus]|uniref:beta-amyrin 6-beta-monooxygenase-like n=1 Tax=Daucus carota subsp. sativus TaxID=79200 RepID=UPI00308378D9
METLVISSLPYALSLLIIPISLSFFLISQKLNAGGSNLNVLPGSSGWPLVGESIKFALAGPQEFIRERTKKYSPDVSQTSLLGEKMVVFCGAQGNKFFFTNESKLLTSWWPQSMKKALLFPEFVETSLREFQL